MTTLRMTSWAPRRLRFAGFAAWRFLEPFYESSDLLEPGHTLTRPFGRASPGVAMMGQWIRRLCSCVPETVF
jgi:hypothetical protein